MRRSITTATSRRASLLPRDLLELRGDCFGKNDSEDLAAMSFLTDTAMAKRVRTDEQTVRVLMLDRLLVRSSLRSKMNATESVMLGGNVVQQIV